MLASAFLVLAAIHAVAGVPTAVLPAVGGLVLLGAALATAPVTRRRLRQNGNGRADVLVFLGALIGADIDWLGYGAVVGVLTAGPVFGLAIYAPYLAPLYVAPYLVTGSLEHVVHRRAR